MTHKIEAVAVMIMLTGFLMITLTSFYASTLEVALVGGLFVAGGTYAMVLPRFIQPQGPATR